MKKNKTGTNKKSENYSELQVLVLERLKTVSPNVIVYVGDNNQKGYKASELIKNVSDNTDLGKQIMKTQLNYIKALSSGKLYEIVTNV